MESKDFIEIFKEILKVNEDYQDILNDLNNNVFPFHDKEKHTSARRFYYWLKQNKSLKFKNLNGELKRLVRNQMKLIN